MIITKEYMERYALLSLICCYDKDLSALMKSEKPDWQSRGLDIGLEVTEALSCDDGRKRFVLSKYFCKGLDGNYIKDQIGQNYSEYSSNIDVSGNVACYSEIYDMDDIIRQVIESINQKTKKLNGHYTIFKNNWLYVFAPDLFCDIDIPVICKGYKEIIPKYKIIFDKLFINARNSIFVLNSEKLENTISLSDECVKWLAIEAQKQLLK